MEVIGAKSPPACQLSATFWSPELAAVVRAGGLASYANGALVTVTDLPALSTQVPDTVALVVLGPEYVVDAHDAIPEYAPALMAPVTGWLYQPAESAARFGPTVAVGEEVST
jgi:hypothetical protein